MVYLLSIAPNCPAQEYTLSGTEFYIADPYEFRHNGYLKANIQELCFFCEQPGSCVRIKLPHSRQFRTLTLNSGTSYCFQLDTLFANVRNANGYLPDSLVNGLLIQSSKSLLLNFHQMYAASYISDVQSFAQNTPIPPTSWYGNKYLHFNSAPDFEETDGGEGGAQYYTIESFTNSAVELELLANSYQFLANQTYTLNLDSLSPFRDTVNFNQDFGETIFQGSYFISNKNNFCFFGTCFSPLVVDQCVLTNRISVNYNPMHNYVPDVSKAGNTFYIQPLPYIKGQVMRFMSTENNNLIYLDGAPLKSLNRGEIWDTCGIFGTVAESDFPMHMSYSTSSSFHKDSTYANSPRPQNMFHTYVQHTGQTISRTRFLVKSYVHADSFFVAFYCKTADTAGFVLNGQPWQNLGFTPFAHDNTYSHAHVWIQPGEYNLQNSAGFIGYQGVYTLNVPYVYNGTHKEERYENYIYPLAGIDVSAMDSSQSVFQYSLDGKKFVPFTTDTPTLCKGQTFYLLPPSERHILWQYNLGNGISFSRQVTHLAPDTVIISYSNTGTYTLNVTQQSWGCVDDAALNIKVVEAGPLDFTKQVELNCEGTFVRAQATGNNYAQFEWYLNEMPVGQGTTLYYQLNNVQSGQTLSVVASNAFCIDSLSQQVTINVDSLSSFYFPNVFSPNGDGINDCFKIAQADLYTNCFSLQIFNRWGKQVFSSTDPNACWEGSRESNGVYFYTVRIGETEINGHVTLIE